ncbi:hypothetical protein [Desulfosediminicola sp.]|uniref:hypothetical protein n=1 Tax=Desulfosediminicola sp. TaxID=2886825 RepID=UPI003AF2B978
MRTIKTNHSCIYRIIITLFTLLLLSSIEAMAKEPVIGKYLSSSGNTIRLQLSVSSPAPQNLILQQHLPPGTRVLSTSPKAIKISQNNGVVKWLFKGVSPGQIEVVMKIEPPAAGSVRGSIRYRMADGTMHEKPVGR